MTKQESVPYLSDLSTTNPATVINLTVSGNPIPVDRYFKLVEEQLEKARQRRELCGKTPAAEPALLSTSMSSLDKFTPRAQSAIREIDAQAVTQPVEEKMALLVCISCLDMVASKIPPGKIISPVEITEIGISLGLIGDPENKVRVASVLKYTKECVNYVLQDEKLKEKVKEIRKKLDQSNEKHTDASEKYAMPPMSPSPDDKPRPARVAKKATVFEKKPTAKRTSKREKGLDSESNYVPANLFDHHFSRIKTMVAEISQGIFGTTSKPPSHESKSKNKTKGEV
ncbi:hypothetical protein M1307_02770 [Patescibacteria group bacterium]|nr:hypothetical protein [Patescibacteria group bacterium]